MSNTSALRMLFVDVFSITPVLVLLNSNVRFDSTVPTEEDVIDHARLREPKESHEPNVPEEGVIPEASVALTSHSFALVGKLIQLPRIVFELLIVVNCCPSNPKVKPTVIGPTPILVADIVKAVTWLCDSLPSRFIWIDILRNTRTRDDSL